MKLPVVLAVLIGTLVVACSTAAPAPVEPTPNIDATVEARLAEEKASLPTSIPSPTKTQAPLPTYTPHPTYTPYPTPTPTPVPTVIPTSTPVPTAIPTSSPYPTPTPTPTPSVYPVSSHPWPMFGGNALHTGRSNYVGPTSGALAWKYPTGGQAADGSPVVGKDGTIYFSGSDSDQNGFLYALTPSGSLKWRHQFSKIASTEFAPALGVHGTIYAAVQGRQIDGDCNGCNGKLYSIYSSGNRNWVLDSFSSSGVPGGVTIGPDGTIYLGGAAISANGSRDWGNGDTIGAAAIASNGNVYDVSSWGGGLTAYSSSGNKLWESPMSGLYSSPSVGADGTVYIKGGGILYAFTNDGALQWQSTKRGINPSSTPAIGSDGTIYSSNDDGNLYAFNPDGTRKWSFSTGKREAQSSPVIDAAGTVYIGGDNLYAVSPLGKLLWSLRIPGGSGLGSPAIGADGTLYIKCGANLCAVK